jgi:hypothetical protein
MVSDGVHRPLIGWTLLALAVAGLVAVGVGALAAPRPIVVAALVFVAASVPAGETPAGWKVYWSEQFGCELSYPPTWS